MLRQGLNWLHSLLESSIPPPTTVNTIESARDWLHQPPVSVSFLKVLQRLSEHSINVSLPFRIIKAWACVEKNGEDIVYIEAILSSEEDISPDVQVMEKIVTVEGKYKIASFLVSQENYKKLLLLQKTQLDHQFQGLGDINQFLVSRMDHDHVNNFIFNMSPRERDHVKEVYSKSGLIFGKNTSYEELLRLVQQHNERGVLVA